MSKKAKKIFGWTFIGLLFFLVTVILPWFIGGWIVVAGVVGGIILVVGFFYLLFKSIEWINEE